MGSSNSSFATKHYACAPIAFPAGILSISVGHNMCTVLLLLRCLLFCSLYLPSVLGRALAQAVSHRPPTAEARVRSRARPCGICGGQSGTGTGFSPSTSVFHCQFHSAGTPLLGKGQKIIIIIFIFIIGLHNKPHGCSASAVAAAGPFTTTVGLVRDGFYYHII
jgi:hypothetical protein